MFKHILLPTDGSALSQNVVEKAIQFAKSIDARITGISVVMKDSVFESDVPAGIKEQIFAERNAASESILARLRQDAQAAGVVCETLLEASDQPYEAIVETAGKKGCDLIMMASHGRRGVGALLIGSETQKVLTHSTIPVLVYR